MSNEEMVIQIQKGETDLIGDLYLNNLNYIRKIVKQYCNDDNYEDLVQESYFGIVDAVKRWNPDLNVKFMVYATYHIKHVILSYLRSKDAEVYLPSFMFDREYSYKAFVNQFFEDHGRNPTIEEIEIHTGFNESQISDIKRAISITKGCKSIYDNVMEQADDMDDIRIIDSIVDPNNDIDDLMNRLEKEELSDKMKSVLQRLPEQESRIIQYRYLKGISLKECSNIFGLSVERVRQIEKHGLKTIRNVYKRELQPFINDYIYQQGLKNTGLNTFRNTFESSVERAVFRLDKKLREHGL